MRNNEKTRTKQGQLHTVHTHPSSSYMFSFLPAWRTTSLRPIDKMGTNSWTSAVTKLPQCSISSGLRSPAVLLRSSSRSSRFPTMLLEKHMESNIVPHCTFVQAISKLQIEFKSFRLHAGSNDVDRWFETINYVILSEILCTDSMKVTKMHKSKGLTERLHIPSAHFCDSFDLEWPVRRA